MVSVFVKVKPSEELTVCISHLLPAIFFNNFSCRTSEIINLVGCTRAAMPAVPPGNSLTIVSEIISAALVFDKLALNDTSLAICNIICIILRLRHCIRHNIATGIQHVQIFL